MSIEHRHHLPTAPMPTERIPNVQKIAVLRANALGDFLFILPALQALRATYPQAEIVLLGKAWHADFLKDRPSPIDRVIAIPRYGGVSAPPEIEEDPLELERFFSQMAQEHFDLALQMHGGGYYSNRFLKNLQARITAGLQTQNAIKLDRGLAYIYFQHEILRYLEVVSLVGANTEQIEPHITVIDKDLEEARAVIPPDTEPLVALHPGATDPRRRWLAINFAQVGDALASTGARVVITGTEDEHDTVTEVITAMQFEAENVCGKLSLGGLAGLLSRCELVVANDTGPLHLASAVGSKTVGIFWCDNMLNVGPLKRMRHRPLISWQLKCPICGKNCLYEQCSHKDSFISDITPAEVINTALELFAQT